MSTRKFKNGDTVVATEKMSIYRQKLGVTPGMKGVVKGYGGQGYYQVEMVNGQLVCESSTAFTKGTPKSSIDLIQEHIDAAKAKIERTQEFINEQQEKINFLKEIGSDTFDPNEFKAYQTLTLIENTQMSKLEKAKAIASLIASK